MRTLPDRNKLCFGHWVAEGADLGIGIFSNKRGWVYRAHGSSPIYKAVLPSEDLGHLHQSPLEYLLKIQLSRLNPALRNLNFYTVLQVIFVSVKVWEPPLKKRYNQDSVKTIEATLGIWIGKHGIQRIKGLLATERPFSMATPSFQKSPTCKNGRSAAVSYLSWLGDPQEDFGSLQHIPCLPSINSCRAACTCCGGTGSPFSSPSGSHMRVSSGPNPSGIVPAKNSEQDSFHALPPVSYRWGDGIESHKIISGIGVV